MEIAIYILSFIILLVIGLNIHFMWMQNKSIDLMSVNFKTDLTGLERKIMERFGKLVYETSQIHVENKEHYQTILFINRTQTEILEKTNENINRIFSIVESQNESIGLVIEKMNQNHLETGFQEESNFNKLQEDNKRVIQAGQNINEKIITIQKQLGIIKP